MYTANDALNELDKFPVFKAELAKLLTKSMAVANFGGFTGGEIVEIARIARQLGAMINLRASQDTGASP
jgi:hypothetical protein